MPFRHRIRRSAAALLILPLSLAACGGQAGGQEVGARSPRASGSVLTAEEIETNRTTVNSMQDLLLLLPGVIATGRGVQIVGLGGTPLFVLNGVPLSDVSAAMGLNPRDIDRVEVVRDGGATAQYGFRGGNGVILIDTK